KLFPGIDITCLRGEPVGNPITNRPWYIFGWEQLFLRRSDDLAHDGIGEAAIGGLGPRRGNETHGLIDDGMRRNLIEKNRLIGAYEKRFLHMIGLIRKPLVEITTEHFLEPPPVATYAIGDF